jgi:hypothetical protein
MEKDKDILERAAEVLKNEKIPPGPSKELIEATISKLTEITRQPDTIQIGDRIRIRERLRAVSKLNKVAVAAVLFIVAGYAVGRLSAPRPIDIKQLQATLVPKIRQELLDEINQHLESSYISLTSELDQRYRQDMKRVAMQILAVSNTATNERLAELIESFNESQVQDRQLFTTMLERIEANRLRDSVVLSDALTTFAQQTEQELERTKQDVIQLLSNVQPSDPVPSPSRDTSH